MKFAPIRHIVVSPFRYAMSTSSLRLIRTTWPLMSAAAATLPAGAHAETNCFLSAAAYQHVSPLVLEAIAWQESHGNAQAVHRNRNGSVDYGMMQINSIHLPVLSQYGVSATDLMNPCASIYVAAWYLHRMNIKYGNTWQAVGAYHSEMPAERDRYARAIAALVGRMTVEAGAGALE